MPSTVLARSMLATTASASNGVPSENVTSSRSVISNVRSSANSHSVARLGSSSTLGRLVDQAVVHRGQVVLVVAVAGAVRVEAARDVDGAVAHDRVGGALLGRLRGSAAVPSAVVPSACASVESLPSAVVASGASVPSVGGVGGGRRRRSPPGPRWRRAHRCRRCRRHRRRRTRRRRGRGRRRARPTACVDRERERTVMGGRPFGLWTETPTAPSPAP